MFEKGILQSNQRENWAPNFLFGSKQILLDLLALLLLLKELQQELQRHYNAAAAAPAHVAAIVVALLIIWAGDTKRCFA